MTGQYHDEDILGKAYDARLMKRLAKFVRPYARFVTLSVLMLVAVTCFELAVPYLTRTALDDYIVSSYRLVTVSKDVELGRLLVDQHASDLIPVDGGDQTSGAGVPTTVTATGTPPPASIPPTAGAALPPATEVRLSSDTARYFVSSKVLSGYDSREVARSTREGVISELRYYVAERSFFEERNLHPSGMLGAGSSVGVPLESLSEIPRGDLLALRAADFRGVTRIALTIVALLLMVFLFTLLQVNVMEVTSQRVMYDVRVKVLRHLQRLSLSFYDKNPVGRLVTRATNDVEVLHEMFTSIVITILHDVFVLLGVVIVLLRLNWRLALVSFIVLPLTGWFTIAFSVRIRDAFREVRVKIARINASLQESISGMRVTQIFRREAESYRRFARINHENFMAAMRQMKVFAMFMPLMELTSSVAIALVIWYGGGKVVQATLSLGTLVAFLTYVQMFFRPLRNLAEQYGTMQQAMASSERIFMLLDTEDTIPEPTAPVRPERVEGRIEFNNVWFAYDEDEWVLRDVSFVVEPGETVAIVGATGAGKTSIISLLERFYDVRRGSITLDAVDIRDMDKGFLRANMALVMQDVFVFAGDIKSNIRLGNESISDEDVRRVAEYVNADRFIGKLPGSYNAEVHERGITLSTGQRQLLAFARALAFDPKILILDEATSNIDTETEYLIQDALVRLMKERTSIVIAHRLSTIQHADKIIVMHHGKIREVGSHQELLAKRGYYYRLYQLQYAQ
ncbi:MAG: ABC transporter ATP-binding protein [Armatimonadetes bacterium]|nr:ABC transporter ATP-binding protein [Armatimonadota bacterium]